MTNNCGHCHNCGHKLKIVLDGEEWCPDCGQYRRYRSHGWADGAAEDSSLICPDVEIITVDVFIQGQYIGQTNVATDSLLGRLATGNYTDAMKNVRHLTNQIAVIQAENTDG